jgi:SAM-dependent methyltransferase
MDDAARSLLEAATRPFRPCGISAWQHARGKLRFDPVYFSLLERGLLPSDGTLLDLGCGQGILLALIAAARRQFRSAFWPAGWPPPPASLRLEGIERHGDRVAVARAALCAEARIEQQDIRSADFPPCSALVILDVMLYLEEDEQGRVLERAVRALDPDGVLILREADAAAGLSFKATEWGARLIEALRGRLRPRLRYRRAADWIGVIEGLGMSVHAEPMSAGTPFANVLFIAKRRTRSACGHRLDLPID